MTKMFGPQSRLFHYLTENPPEASAYRISSWLFIKVIALIYLAAFLSLSVQVVGLVGENGILPVGSFLQHLENLLGNKAWFRVPTLLWIDHSDLTLQIICYLGAVFSVLLFLGRFKFVSAIMLFVLYLSLLHPGQTFLNFQWDYLLLEAGFLTIFLVKSQNRIVIFLFHWLLFRLRFLSGMSKLSDPLWINFDTLKYYFETQPLPHPGSWYFHQLPDWILRAGTGFTLFVELVVPFFIFLPRRFRHFAAVSTIVLQLLIIASSNHNWINLLTIALCLFLLDDKLMKKAIPDQLLSRVNRSTVSVTRLLPASVFAAVLICTTSVATVADVFAGIRSPEAFRWVRGYGLGNAYHVFPTMQAERYEFSIEGSDDGVIWKQYLFKYKPNSVEEIPPFIVPHQPRLDWMIWFVPAKNPEMRYWFDAFIAGLSRNSPAIISLLANNPFPEKPPHHIRVATYRLEFTDWQERQETGKIWRSEYLGDFPFVPARRP